MSFQIRRLNEKPKKPFFLLRLSRRVPWKRIFGTAFLLSKPLLKLGTRFFKRREHERRFKRTITIAAACLVALCILLFTTALVIRVSGISLGPIASLTSEPLAATAEGITNILLLGQGDESHDGIDLTDSIMLASIDPSTPPRQARGRSGQVPSVMLLSLPRDLYFLHTENMDKEQGKLNALWRDNRILLSKQGNDLEEASQLSLRQLATEIGDALGITVHHAIKVDFIAFERAVDALGGVDISVPETIHDTEYPAPNYAFQTFHIDAGAQHLSGTTALKYARTRSTTSDFDRSARQQQILQALAKKGELSALLSHPKKIQELYSILRENILTDLTLRQLLSLIMIAKDTPEDSVRSLQLNNVNGLYGEQLFPGGILYAPPRDLFEGAAVLLPISIPEFPVTWKQVRLLAHLFFEERFLYLSAPRIAVLNGGAPEGSAGRLGQELTKFGFNVVSVANREERKTVEKSFISVKSTGNNEEAAQFFSKLFSFSVGTPEQALGEGEDEDIILVLGEDYAFQRFQDLVPL